MTNEEAIKLIDDRMCFGRGKWSEHHKPEIDIYWQAGEMAIKALEQPKRGKWIYHIDDLFPAESTKECDQCHAEQPLTCDDEFCPHCGAKMEVTE